MQFNWWNPEEQLMPTVSQATAKAQMPKSGAADQATMKAIAVHPGKPNTMHLREVR